MNSTIKLGDIVHEQGNHWVVRYDKGFKVFRSGVVASTLCATIGYTGQKGLDKAKAECDRREAL